MKRELIIVSIVIVCIIVAGILSQNHTKREIFDVDSKLENLKSEIIRNDKSYTEYTKEIDRIYDDWEEKNEILSLYLEHNELEKINTLLKTIKGYLEVDKSYDSIQEIESCIAILDHIEEKQAFNIKNIF